MVDHRTVLTFALLFFSVLLESLLGQREESLTAPGERSALLELRSTLGLRAYEWPIKGDPCSKWVGIRCENGSVAEINIAGFKRTRIGKQNPRFAVDSLLNLTNLVSFNASRLSLPGSIPDWLGPRMSKLRVLDLSSCSISGAVPLSFGNLTNLRVLNLSGNSLNSSIPQTLRQLSSLLTMDLSRNEFNGPVPSSLGSLGNLSSLDISMNFLSGSIPPDIGTLSRLRSLNLSNNDLSSLIPPQLGDLHSLVDLDLSFNRLSGSIPDDLRGLQNLQRMNLGGNEFSGSLPIDLFTPRSQLLLVILKHNSLSGSVPDFLWSLPELRLLDLSGNNFSSMLPNSSFNSSVAYAKLNISGNMFYGGLPSVLERFNVIDISENYFQGKLPAHMPKNASAHTNCLQNVSDQRSRTACSMFYSRLGLIFDNFGLPRESPGKKSSGLSRTTIIILAAVAGSIGVILIFILLPVVLTMCFRRSRGTTSRGNGVEPAPLGGGSPPSAGVSVNYSSLGQSFKFEQLVLATKDFSDSNLIKRGHSGDLFLGTLENGIPVVVKRIDLGPTDSEAYLTELDFFSRVSHPRFVPLLGHCLENVNQKFLVYKYMPNGDLASSLYRKKSDSEEDGLQSLDWITRLKIATGAAEGLSYLHHECSPPLVHRDVQPSSILLDDKFEVRLGSLSEACVQEGDPHQSKISKLLRLPQTSQQGARGSATSTCTHDVYCFGKVLVELVTGKIGMTKEDIDEAIRHINMNDKELVTKIVDPTLIVDEDLLEEVWAMAIVARTCLNPRPSRRPLMRHILSALENPLKVVRDDSTGGSRRLRANSSTRSWNAAIFSSWRHSTSDVAAKPPPKAEDLKQSTSRSTDRSSSRRQQMSDIVPEPAETTRTEGLRTGSRSSNRSSSRRRQMSEIVPEPVETVNLEGLKHTVSRSSDRSSSRRRHMSEVAPVPAETRDVQRDETLL